MKIIPKKTRIKVYKRALKVLENEEEDWDSGLCILLRNLYYGYNAYIRQPFELTSERFPEFSKYYKCFFGYPFEDQIKFEKLYNKDEHIWRRVVLRLILEELKVNEEI